MKYLVMLFVIVPTLLSAGTPEKPASSKESYTSIPDNQLIYYRVEKGDSYQSLARLYKVSAERIRKLNRAVRLKPEVLIRLPIYRLHKVKAGDTFSTLSKRYKIPLKKFREIHRQQLKAQKIPSNRLSANRRSGNLLYVGEYLRIPVDYPSNIWLYSAYIRSQYKRLSELVQVTNSSDKKNTRKHKFSAELNKIVPLELADSLPMLSATEDNLQFSLPFQNSKISLGQIRGFEISEGRFQPGIFYKVKREVRIHASEDGEVVFIGPLRGWGVGVVIRHSGNFFSLYSGMKKVVKKTKEKVSQDDVIGTTRIGMFFSLHYKGLPIDPLEFF